jgi:hypothetical protein
MNQGKQSNTLSFLPFFQRRADRSAEDRRLRKAEAAGSNPAQSIHSQPENKAMHTFFNFSPLSSHDRDYQGE